MLLPSIREWIITPEQVSQRLDNFLLTRLKGLPKSCLYRLLRQGKIRVNQKRSKPAYRLQANDVLKTPLLRLDTAPVVLRKPSDSLRILLKKSILFEDDKLIILNKPQHMAVHGGSGISLGIIEALRQLRPTQAYLELAHRLDRETSGCLLIAKKPAVLRQLHMLFRTQCIEKTYLTLVSGYWSAALKSINVSLKKNQLRSGERIVKVDAEGKSAFTQFKLLKRFTNASLLEVKLRTGRTHQIRVHAQYAGHPVAGDEKYGDKAFNQVLRANGLQRLFLHAAQVRFTLPLAAQSICVQATLPPDLRATLKQLVEHSI